MSEISKEIRKGLKDIEKACYKLSKDKANQAIYNKVLSQNKIAQFAATKIENIESEISKLEKQKKEQIAKAMKAITEATILIKTIK